MSERVSATFRAPMRRVLLVTTLGFGALLPAGMTGGWLLGGSDVGLGLGLGLLVPAVFFGLTVVAGILAAPLDNAPFVGVIMASWLVKMVALMVVMALIKDADFYDTVALFVAFVVGVTGWLVAEIVVTLRARIPYVDVEVPGGA